jgi:hypothetical protein
MAEPMALEIPSSKTGKLKGKKLIFSPPVATEKKSNLKDLLLYQQLNNMLL